VLELPGNHQMFLSHFHAELCTSPYDQHYPLLLRALVYSLNNSVAMHIPFETSIPSDQQLITRSCPRRLAPRQSPICPNHDVQQKYIRFGTRHPFVWSRLSTLKRDETRNTLMMRP
jgi:hypothetical protein